MTPRTRWTQVPELMDREWLIQQKLKRVGAKQIAKQFGICERSVREAYRYHGIIHGYVRINNPKLKNALDKLNTK